MNENNIETLLELNKEKNLNFSLYLEDKLYPLSDVIISKSPNPVSSPTLRGGVYISDQYDYKISGTINDVSIIPLLSKTMLGPNTDFTELKLVTKYADGNETKNYSVFAYLTNSIQSSSKININLSIIRLEMD